MTAAGPSFPRRARRLMAAAVCAATTASPALAHHSFAAFDQTRQLALSGAVRDFQWTNPHSWVQLAVTGPDGAVQDWAIEALSPNVLGRMGWKKTSLKTGDQVVLVINPTRDGSRGGSLVRATGADGRAIGAGR
jgi:hypothetical protein